MTPSEQRSTAQSSGGIYAQKDSLSAARLHVSSHETAASGDVLASLQADAMLIDSTFLGNRSTNGGRVYRQRHGAFGGCAVTENGATISGGRLYARATDLEVHSSTGSTGVWLATFWCRRG